MSVSENGGQGTYGANRNQRHIYDDIKQKTVGKANTGYIQARENARKSDKKYSDTKTKEIVGRIIIDRAEELQQEKRLSMLAIIAILNSSDEIDKCIKKAQQCIDDLDSNEQNTRKIKLNGNNMKMSIQHAYRRILLEIAIRENMKSLQELYSPKVLSQILHFENKELMELSKSICDNACNALYEESLSMTSKENKKVWNKLVKEAREAMITVSNAIMRKAQSQEKKQDCGNVDFGDL